MTVKEDLHRLVELLPEDEAAEALDYLHWLMLDGETLADGESQMLRKGEEEIARGEYVTLDDLERSVDR